MNRLLLYTSLLITAVFLIAAVCAPWLAPFDPELINLREQLLGPGAQHWLGQDANGSDILSRLVFGARISLFVGVSVVAISTVIGLVIGLWAGYYGGWVDTVLMRLVDVLLAFPGLLLAIGLVAVLGPALQNIVIALCVLGWVGYARLVRAQVLSMKSRDFVCAAQVSGQSDWRIMRTHIAPNIMAPVIVQASFSFAGVIIAESSLSFLGLGVPPGTPSWGAMLSEGKQVILDAPHVAFFPGLAIMLLVLACNVIGDYLRDRYDPKSPH